MSRYAQTTNVPVGRTKSEIEQTLQRYGADNIIIGTSVSQSKALVQFTYKQLPLEICLSLPEFTDEQFWKTPGGRMRANRRKGEIAAKIAWETACRQQWRVLLLMLKGLRILPRKSPLALAAG